MTEPARLLSARMEPARAHGLRSLALAALARHVDTAEAAARATGEAGFLLDYLGAIGDSGTDLGEAFDACRRQPAPVDIPLLRLGKELALTPLELLSVALAAAVEDDAMVGRAIAYLQAPLGGSRPLISLLTTALAPLAPAGSTALDQLVTGRAIAAGVLTLAGEGAPLPERPVAVPLHLCHALRGYDGTFPNAVIGVAEINRVALPPSLIEVASRHAAALQAAPRRALVLRTGSPLEGRAVTDAIAQSLARRPIFLETEQTAGLGPWLLLRDLLPVFYLELAPGERKLLPELPGYRGPVLAICGPDGSLESSGGTVLNWALGVPPPEERALLWQQAVGDSGLSAELAGRYRHGSGRIAQLARLARHRGALAGRVQPTREDVIGASRAGEATSLEALAQLVTDEVADEALVLSATLQLEVERLLLRCRARDGLAQGLGPSLRARYSPGVRALFVGSSGTGKTLAAAWLATRLGLPLYRVDLAAVTSKYIGETEKNLAQLLARAERAEVVLLFDEADSLFGKRTDVKEANDRFANAQTNYLLQRIESFDGISILTSNSRSRFDSSFSRRLDVIVDFPLPGAEERLRLWQSHLGTHHSLRVKDLNRLAAAADLCGGHIRNVVLLAAVLARGAARPIEYGDVLEGLIVEYRKIGRQLPVELKTRV